MNTAMLTHLMAGAITMGAWAVALFFLRFWKQTRDNLFACFALAFFLLGVERLGLVWTAETETAHFVYLIRLWAFVLIAVGIAGKNRANKR